jgi:hypothetical protein
LEESGFYDRGGAFRGLGVGANTAIFSIVDAVVSRSLPFSHPDRLVKIVANTRGVGARDIGPSVVEFDDLRSKGGCL